MQNFLIIYAHPNPESFNAAIKNKILTTLKTKRIPFRLIDLYAENYNPVLSLDELKGKTTDETIHFQKIISESTNIIFVFPVFWFRAPAILEGFIDKVFVPGFAYRFKQLFGKYGMPIPMLSDKKVLTIVTHGAPALPVKTIYVNAVKFRFLLGFLSFCFNLFKCQFLQLWSVPFIEQKVREKYLMKVERLVLKQLKK